MADLDIGLAFSLSWHLDRRHRLAHRLPAPPARVARSRLIELWLLPDMSWNRKSGRPGLKGDYKPMGVYGRLCTLRILSRSNFACFIWALASSRMRVALEL